MSNAVSYAMHNSRSHDAMICVYDEAGNVIETHEHKRDFEEGEAVLTNEAHGFEKRE